MLRRLAFFVGIGAVSVSHASFELGLVLQNVRPSGLDSFRAITRWDTVSRVSLGYFLVTGTTDDVVALNPGAPGTIDTFGRSGSSLQIRRYNYGTGVLSSVINTGVPLSFMYDARYVSSTGLLIAGSFGGTLAARLYSTSGFLLRAYVNPAGTNLVMSAVQDSAGNTYVLTRQPGSISGSKYTVSSYAAGSSAIASSVTIQDNTTLDPKELTLANGFLAVNTGTLSSRRILTVSGTTMGAPYSPGGFVLSTATFAAGHEDLIHGFSYDFTNTRMILSTARIDNGAGDSFQFINSTFYSGVLDSAIVVAPEPGTMLALGAGVAALLRRRSKAKTAK